MGIVDGTIAPACNAGTLFYVQTQQTLTQVVEQVTPTLGIEGALAILVGLTASAVWINEKIFHLPSAIASMLAGLAFAMGTLLLDRFGFQYSDMTARFISQYPFDKIVLNGVLPFLLFAAAMQIDLRVLKRSSLQVIYLATIGILVFAAIESGMAYLILWALPGNLDTTSITWPATLLFASLIAPTDAAAVMSVLRRSNAPKRLRTIIAGESLFNDATSIVLFTAILAYVSGQDKPASGAIAIGLFTEIGGGFLIGAVIGGIGALLIRFSKEPSTQVMVMLAVVLGGTQISLIAGASAPLAVVIAGIIIARYRITAADDIQHPTNAVWSVLDQILNGILFFLLGMELLAIKEWNTYVLLGGVLCFPAIIVARYLSLFIPWTIFNRGIPNRELIILSWCGIRGGVSIALALQIPVSIAGGSIRDAFVLGAFITVVLSMLIQGISAPKIVEKLSRNMENEKDNSEPRPTT